MASSRWSASLARVFLADAAVMDRGVRSSVRREVEVLTGLLKVVLPDPQPLAWWDLEVVEPAHQPQIAEIHVSSLPIGQQASTGSSGSAWTHANATIHVCRSLR
jgi:hypothetical protein